MYAQKERFEWALSEVEKAYYQHRGNIEVQEKKSWKVLSKKATPGWISPQLPKDSIFRITLDGATRSSPLLSSNATITPTMLADLSVDKGATFGSVMGELTINEQNGDILSVSEDY